MNKTQFESEKQVRQKMSETDRSNFVTNLQVNETIKKLLLEQLKNKKKED